jgi:hypothetical protein
MACYAGLLLVTNAPLKFLNWTQNLQAQKHHSSHNEEGETCTLSWEGDGY